ncbi:MAG: hypothetical protein ACLFV5_01395 [Anaerolineales bacterium]
MATVALRVAGLLPPSAEEYPGAPDPVASEGLETTLIDAGIEGARVVAFPIKGSDVRFRVAGFGELARTLDIKENGFDALLCLGNSLPHVLTSEDLTATLAGCF